MDCKGTHTWNHLVAGSVTCFGCGISCTHETRYKSGACDRCGSKNPTVTITNFTISFKKETLSEDELFCTACSAKVTHCKCEAGKMAEEVAKKVLSPKCDHTLSPVEGDANLVICHECKTYAKPFTTPDGVLSWSKLFNCEHDWQDVDDGFAEECSKCKVRTDPNYDPSSPCDHKWEENWKDGEYYCSNCGEPKVIDATDKTIGAKTFAHTGASEALLSDVIQALKEKGVIPEKVEDKVLLYFLKKQGFDFFSALEKGLVTNNYEAVAAMVMPANILSLVSKEMDKEVDKAVESVESFGMVVPEGLFKKTLGAAKMTAKEAEFMKEMKNKGLLCDHDYQKIPASNPQIFNYDNQCTKCGSYEKVKKVSCDHSWRFSVTTMKSWLQCDHCGKAQYWKKSASTCEHDAISSDVIGIEFCQDCGLMATQVSDALKTKGFSMSSSVKPKHEHKYVYTGTGNTCETCGHQPKEETVKSGCNHQWLNINPPSAKTPAFLCKICQVTWKSQGCPVGHHDFQYEVTKAGKPTYHCALCDQVIPLKGTTSEEKPVTSCAHANVKTLPNGAIFCTECGDNLTFNKEWKDKATANIEAKIKEKLGEMSGKTAAYKLCLHEQVTITPTGETWCDDCKVQLKIVGAGDKGKGMLPIETFDKELKELAEKAKAEIKESFGVSTGELASGGITPEKLTKLTELTNKLKIAGIVGKVPLKNEYTDECVHKWLYYEPDNLVCEFCVEKKESTPHPEAQEGCEHSWAIVDGMEIKGDADFSMDQIIICRTCGLVYPHIPGISKGRLFAGDIFKIAEQNTDVDFHVKRWRERKCIWLAVLHGCVEDLALQLRRAKNKGNVKEALVGDRNLILDATNDDEANPEADNR